MGEFHPARVLRSHRFCRPREEGDRASVCAVLGEDEL